MEKLPSASANISTDGELSKESLEQLCHTKLSLPQIRSLVDFCNEKVYKDRFGYKTYDAFVSDVPERDKEKNIDVTFLEKIRIRGLSHFSDGHPKGFEYIRYFAKEAKTDDEIAPSIYGRLYICPSIENTPVLMKKIIEQHYDNKKDLVCKVSRTGARNDRIVIYLTEDFGDEIKIIKDIQNDSPESFVDCGKNRLWCNIDGVDDVYFGSEPTNDRVTYGLDRASVIGKISTLQQEGLVDTDDDKRLYEIFKIACLSRQVNPFNFGFYINNEVIGRAANTLLLDNSEKFRQSRLYMEKKALVDKWLEENEDSSEESWLGNNIPEFNNS